MPGPLLRVLDVITSRWFVKGAFLAFFVWLATRLLAFAAWARGEGPFVPRPEAVAGILPVGHFTSFFAWLKGGGWDTLLPAGLVIILAALATSLVLKRGFCGWICPVGTVWEAAAALGRRLIGRNIRPPKWLDRTGMGLRYLIGLAFFAFVGMVSLAEAVGFREFPYMWVADIKIIEGFGNPAFIAVALLVFVVSMLLGPVWCRYLCPLGALYSAVGLASPCAVERDDESCIECGRCSKICHAFVDVQRAGVVRAPECDGCMDCVKVCPVDGCLEAKVVRRVRIAPWVWPLAVVGLWLGIYAVAKFTGNWDTAIPADVFRQVINSGLLEQTTPMF
ncbi:MAG: 4Fe-4S binding protein [Coriobacteriia bacterium]|nr:4Fe-4S binding protein [Coriobacteriia bacterium]